MVSKKEANSNKNVATYLVIGILLIVAIVFSFMKLSNVGFSIYSLNSNTNNTSEWLMFQRGLGHTGWDGVNVTYTVGLNRANYTTGPVNSSFIVSGGNLYVFSGNVLYKLDASNISDQISNVTLKSSSFSASPVLVNGKLYAVSDAGILYAFNSSNLSQQEGNFTTGVSMGVSPSIAGRYVYLANSNLYQLNVSNLSQVISEFSNAGMNYSVPAVAKGYVYAGSADGYLYQLNASNVSDASSSYFFNASVASSPAVSNGYVYIASGNTTYQLNASNVSVLVSSYTTGSNIIDSPAVSNGYVYIASGNTTYQLNASNVSQVVSSYSAKEKIVSSPSLLSGYVYVVSGVNSTTYQLNASNVSQVVSSYETGSQSYLSSPAVTSDYVYIASGNTTYQLNSGMVNMANDFTAPTVQISFPADMTYEAFEPSEIDFTISDNVGLASCGYSVNGGSTNKSINCTADNVTGLSAQQGTNKWLVYAKDTSGNVKSVEVVFTVNTTSSTTTTKTNTQNTSTQTTTTQNNALSQGAAPSNGASAASGSVSNIKTITSLVKNQPLAVNVANMTNIGILGLIFDVRQNISSASFSINNVSGVVPSDLGAGSGFVYKSFNINLTGISNSMINNITINFKVDSNWMKGNSLDPLSTKLYINSSLGWEPLSTNFTNSSSGSYSFKAVAPGASAYSIFVGSTSCTAGQERCLGSEVQKCASANNWTSVKSCSLGCSQGVCVSKNNFSGAVVSVVPLFLRTIWGEIIYFVVLALVVVGLVFLGIASVKRKFFRIAGLKIKKIFKKKDKDQSTI